MIFAPVMLALICIAGRGKVAWDTCYIVHIDIDTKQAHTKPHLPTKRSHKNTNIVS